MGSSMKIKATLCSLALSLVAANSMAAENKPMPTSITVPDRAVVPVVKTQVIRSVEGQEPVRTTEATVFEVTNKGKDIVAKEIYMADKDMNFSEASMAPPMIRRGSMIVPTFKIEETKRVTQEGQLLSETKHVDAAGMEFRRGENQPIKRQLTLEQNKDPKSTEQITHKVESENGVVTSDVVILEKAN